MASLGSGRPVRTVPVQGEGGTFLCDATIVEDGRVGRMLDALPLRPTAITFGRYVFARDTLPDPLVRHELEHVRQWSRLGPLFLPSYLAESARATLRGEDRYRGNRLEIAARAREREPGRTGAGTADSADPG